MIPRLPHMLAILITLILTAFSGVGDVFAQDCRFVSIKGLVEQEIGRIVLPQVYKKLGLKIHITPMPGKRAEKEAASGKADGEIMRIWSYGEENPTLIRVPTPYYQLETTAFVRADSGITISSRDELERYSLVRVRGVKHTANITEGMSHVTDVENSRQLMKFLQIGRAEVALTNTIDGLQILQQNSMENIVALPGPLAELNLYHYIHKSHADLVMRVNGVISEMVQSGEMQQLIHRAEQQVYSLP